MQQVVLHRFPDHRQHVDEGEADDVEHQHHGDHAEHGLLIQEHPECPVEVQDDHGNDAAAHDHQWQHHLQQNNTQGFMMAPAHPIPILAIVVLPLIHDPPLPLCCSCCV